MLKAIFLALLFLALAFFLVSLHPRAAAAFNWVGAGLAAATLAAIISYVSSS